MQKKHHKTKNLHSKKSLKHISHQKKKERTFVCYKFVRVPQQCTEVICTQPLTVGLSLFQCD